MNKEKQLQQLNKKFTKKIKSPLLQTCKQIIYGHGNPNAKIIFIGEAPGRKEDELGLPFVGASGKFLDQMLKSIKLNREDVYVTNIIKCRPPQNRDPLKIEKKEFFPWLLQEIKIIKPKLIITLGRHPLSAFISQPIIAQTHGKILFSDLPTIKKIKIYSLYHPAAALYNGKMRQTLIADFKKIPKLLNK